MRKGSTPPFNKCHSIHLPLHHVRTQEGWPEPNRTRALRILSECTLWWMVGECRVFTRVRGRGHSPTSLRGSDADPIGWRLQ